MKLLADIGKAEDPVGCDSSHHSGMDWNVLGEYADDIGSFWGIDAKERGYVWDGMTALAAIEGAKPGTGAAATEIFIGSLSGWDSPRARFKRDGTMLGLAEATWQTARPGGGALAWDSPLVDGSTRGVYGAAGEFLAMVGYAPYGAPSHTNAGAAPTFTYTGKPLDTATGLYHFPYRQYDPKASRWLTRDPLGMVDGPNVYAYVTGNPVGAVDPLGLWSWCGLICAGICGGIGGGAALICAPSICGAVACGVVTGVTCYVVCESLCNMEDSPDDCCEPPEPLPDDDCHSPDCYDGEGEPDSYDPGLLQRRAFQTKGY